MWRLRLVSNNLYYAVGHDGNRLLCLRRVLGGLEVLLEHVLPLLVPLPIGIFHGMAMVVAPCFVLSLPIAHLFATRLMGDRRRRRGELLCVLDCSVISIPILGRFNAPRQTFFLLALLPYEGLKRLIEVVEEGAVAEVADMVGHRSGSVSCRLGPRRQVSPSILTTWPT